VDDYGWVYKGRQEFPSPPVNGGGWEYRNVAPATRQVLSGYEASRTVPVYGWVVRSGEEPPLGATVWDDPLLGRVEGEGAGVRVVYGRETADQPREGWIRNLERTWMVQRIPRMVVESYTAYHLLEVPSAWTPVTSEVLVSPKNGYSGAVRLRAEGGRLGTDRLHLSPPARTSLSAGPGVARIWAYALDARGVEREVAGSEFRVEAGGEARYVGDVLLTDENSRVLSSTEGEKVSGLLSLDDNFLRGIYDGGSAGGPITQFFTVNFATGKYVYRSVKFSLGNGIYYYHERSEDEMDAFRFSRLVNLPIPIP